MKKLLALAVALVMILSVSLAFADGINGISNTVDWATLGKTIGDLFKGVLDFLRTAIEEVDWGQLAKDVEDFLVSIDWTGIIESLYGLSGAMAGAMFETFVINEILKSYSNEGLEYDFDVYYYNGRDKKKKNESGEPVEVDGEIDLIIQENGILYPVEIKMSTMPKASMASEFDVLDGIPDKKRGMGAIICLLDRKLYLRENLVALPLEYL